MSRRLILLGLAGSLLAGCASMSAASGALDPLSEHIRDGQKVGEVVRLTPGVFPVGMSRIDAEDLLRRNGYSRIALTARGQKPDTEGAEHYQRTISTFPCLTAFDIYVRYDAGDRIAHVEGTMTQLACA